MNAHTPITAANPLADTARAIVAEPLKSWHGKIARDLQSEAQLYIDNLADGCDEPDELLRLLARSDAAEEFTGKDWLFDDWFDDNEDHYVSERQVFHGMVGEVA